MNTLGSKMEVMQNIGTGLSVDRLCTVCNITFDELCELASEYPELHMELKRWYKRYDFTPKTKPTAEELKSAISKITSAMDEGQTVDYIVSKETADKITEDKPLETKKKTTKRTKKTEQ